MKRHWPTYLIGMAVSGIIPLVLCVAAFWANNVGAAFLLGICGGVIAVFGGMISGSAERADWSK